MHIFFDESGNFVIPSDKAPSPCVIGALAVPDFKKDQLFEKYARIRRSLPKENGEVKGRHLCERDVARVVKILRQNSCIYKAHIIEMSFEKTSEIEDHKKVQAQRLTDNLTEKHQPNLVEHIWQLRSELEKMAPQLYVQYTMLSDLIAELLKDLVLYWAQRSMKELLNFHWMVDGKGNSDQTKTEDWWSKVKFGTLESRLERDPVLFLREIDYSEFATKFGMSSPGYLNETDLSSDEGFSLNLLLGEDFCFSSGNDFGLELVDILTNATRRALKGNLKQEGWQDIPKLMIARNTPYLKFSTFGNSTRVKNLPYRRIVTGQFAKNGRPMLTTQSRSYKGN
ncbi:MAG: hypothetical protein RLZZ157_1526 [Pseudomonadota bacterium]|jgi:hypothetical protein